MPNEFLPFAYDPAANMMPLADYTNPTFAARTLGFTTGTALSAQLNRVWHQSSLMTSMLGEFVVRETGLDMLDDGSVSGQTALLTNYRAALVSVVGSVVNAGGSGYVKLTGDTMTGTLVAPVIGINAGVGANSLLGFDRGAGQYGYLQANTAGLGRWQLQLANNEPETGANAGSNLGFIRFDDAGNYMDSPLSINRATGRVNFTVNPTINGNIFPYLPIVGGDLQGPMGAGGNGIQYHGVGWAGYMAFGWNATNGSIMAAVNGTYIGELATQGWAAGQLGNYLPIWGGTITGSLQVNGNFVTNGQAGFRSSVWFANLGDFINFWDGRFRFRQWAGDWYDAWDGQTGTRAWAAPNAWIMTLDGGGNLWTLGTLRVGGARIISNGAGSSVAAHWPGLSAVGFWQGDDSAMWFGHTDGNGNPTQGQMQLRTDGRLTIWGGLSATADGWFGAGVRMEGGLWVGQPSYFASNLGVAGEIHSNSLVTDGDVDMRGTAFAARFFSRSTVCVGDWEFRLETDGGNGRYLFFQNGYYFVFDKSNGALQWMRGGMQMMLWDGAGILWYNGPTAYKWGGGQWSGFSDQRIKTIDGDYTRGLSAILHLNPIRYHYTADAGPNAPKQIEFIGLVAQDAEEVMPEMVHQTEGEIAGHKVHDMRAMDTTAIQYALINAMKEIDARLKALEGK